MKTIADKLAGAGYVTGQAGNAKAITEEFNEVFKGLDEAIYDRIVIGCTDTPSANVSAWASLALPSHRRLLLAPSERHRQY